MPPQRLTSRESLSFAAVLLVTIFLSSFELLTHSNYFLYGQLSSFFPSKPSNNSAVILVRDANPIALNTLKRINRNNKIVVIPDGFDKKSLQAMKDMTLKFAVSGDNFWLNDFEKSEYVCILQPLIVQSHVVGAYKNETMAPDCSYYFDTAISPNKKTLSQKNSSKAAMVVKEYLIDFSIDTNSIAQIDLESITNGQLNLSWLKNHFVFVIRDFESLSQGYTLPNSSKQVSLGIVQSLIAETKRNNQQLTLVSIFYLPLALILALGPVLMVNLQRTVKSALLRNGLILIAYSGITTFFAWKFSKMLPLTEILVSHLLILITTLINKQIHFERSFQTISTDLQKVLQERRIDQAYYEQEELWEAMHRMIHQYLFLKRSIFLKLNKNSTHVSEISGYQCQLDDIHEPRRDHRREPYKSAIAKDVILIERDFFNNLEPGERQFIASLTFAGELVGFWVMTVAEDQGFNSQAFIRNVKTFATEIAELVFHHRHLQLHRKNSKSWLINILNQNKFKRVFRRAKGNFESIKKRLLLVENVFDGLTSPIVLFDLFGRAIHVNNAMEHLIDEIGFELYNNTALELLSHVTKLSRKEARGKLRFIMLNQQKSEFLLKDVIVGNDYLLKLNPIIADQYQRNDVAFSTTGILFEFINVSDVTNIALSKQDYFHKYFYEFKRNNFNNENLQQFIELGEESIHGGIDYSGDPINPIRIVKQVITKKRKIAINNSFCLTMQDDLPPILVKIEERILKNIIAEVISLLLLDSIRGSEIKIIIELQETLNITFLNTGFGVIHEKLHDDLIGNSQVLERQIASWKKELAPMKHIVNAKHTVGTGIRVSFHFNFYKLSLTNRLKSAY